MIRFVRWMAMCACALATGCASVAGGNTQKMYVQVQTQEGVPVSGADCSLSNDKGTWHIKAPGDTSITRSNKRMEVKCDKSPLPQGIVSVESSTRSAVFGNILIGGVVGAVVDHSSGAAYEYPEMIKVMMGRFTSLDQPKGATAAATAEAQKNDRLRQDKAIAASAAGVSQQTFVASGYARLDDAQAVPYLSDKGREAYRVWAARPNPKAFGVAPNGYYFTASGTAPQDKTLPTDPVERAVVGCERAAHMQCKLYAVDDNVVWVKDAAAPQPSAAAAVSPAPAARPVAAAVTPGTQPAPIASGYAALDDVDAVPYLSDRGREGYRAYLTRPTPKAFAISAAGHWFSAWTLVPGDATLPTDPVERAVVGCNRTSPTPCKLYAVNGAVVWPGAPIAQGK